MTNGNEKSLGDLLAALADKPLGHEGKGRRRLAILADAIWRHALQGDRDCLKVLLDKLPTEKVAEATEQRCINCGNHPHQWTPRPDPFDQLTNILRGLVEAKVLPDRLFEEYKIVPAAGNPERAIVIDLKQELLDAEVKAEPQ